MRERASLASVSVDIRAPSVRSCELKLFDEP